MRTVIAIVGAAVVFGAATFLIFNQFGSSAPWAGTWKVTIFEPNAEVDLWIIELGGTREQPTASIEAGGPQDVQDAEVADISIRDGALRIEIDLLGSKHFIDAYFPESGTATALSGSVQFGLERQILKLEKTDQTQLSEEEYFRRTVPAQEFQRVAAMRDPKEQKAALENMGKVHADHPIRYYAALGLLQHAVLEKAQPEQLEEAARQVQEIARKYGREMELYASTQVLPYMVIAEESGDLARKLVDEVEGTLKDSDAVLFRIAVLRELATSLSRLKDDEVVQRIDKLLQDSEAELVQLTSPTEEATERQVLVELFTGTSCPPCVSADVAFDALSRSHKESAIFLQYHIHVPGPDPMTNSDSESRSGYYRTPGTPAIYIDGYEGPGLGGVLSQSQTHYDSLRKAVDKKVSTSPKASLSLSAEQTGQSIKMTAQVGELSKTGENIRLRFVLVQDMVKFPGSNGQRFHHNVVRAFPGGVRGIPMPEKTGSFAVEINLDELKKSLDKDLTESRFGQVFPPDLRPLDLEGLFVVAYIQDDRSQEVFQAVQAKP